MNTTFTTKGTLSGYDSEGYIFIEEEPTGRPVMLKASKNMMRYLRYDNPLYIVTSRFTSASVFPDV